MAEESPGKQKSNTGDSSQRRMQQPKLCGRHFFEKAADPADEIVPGKKRQVVNSNNGGGQCGRRDPRIKSKRNRKDIGNPALFKTWKVMSQPIDTCPPE